MNRLTKVYLKETDASTPELLEEYSYSILSDGKTQKIYKKYITDTECLITIYTYNYRDKLVEQQNPDGTKLTYCYNSNGTLNTSTDARGSITYYKYDGLNRLTEKWVPLAVENGAVKYTYSKIEYDKADRKTAEKTGKVSTVLYEVPTSLISVNYEYYPNGKVKSITESSGKKIAYQYDNDGNASREDVYTDDSNMNTTEYLYNQRGKVTQKKVHARAGDIYGKDFNSDKDIILITYYTYDKNGNLKTEKTPDKVVTTYTYDNLDRQLTKSQPCINENGLADIRTLSVTYDSEGNKATSTDANGVITTYTYNKRGFLTKANISGVNATTLYAYDRAGRKTVEISPKNYKGDVNDDVTQMNRTEYTYDKMDRVKTKIYIYTDPATSQTLTTVAKAYKYDNNGNVVKELDALGYASGTGSTADQKINSGYGTEYTYNLANKAITVIDPVSKERNLAFTTKYEYDGLGRKISGINANNAVTKYYYDDAGNITSVKIKKSSTDPEQTLKTNTYDYIGNVKSTTDGNGNTTTYEYNVFNKLRKAVTPSDSTIESNTLIYQYDVMGNLKKKQSSVGTVDLYTYDKQGRELSHTQQSLKGKEKIKTSKRYDKNGNVKVEVDGNGVEKQRTYDAANRVLTETITSKDYDNQPTTHTTTYIYDLNGNVLTKTDSLNGISTSVLTYTYDPLDRLILKEDPYNNKEIADINRKFVQKLEYNANNLQIKSYDAKNNITQFYYDTNNRLITTVDPMGHETTQGYDNAGNVSSKTDGNGNKTLYTYDELNRLVLVTNAKGETTSYTYDLNNNILTQTDGSGHVSAFEYNAGNKPIKRIDHGGKDGSTYVQSKVESYTYYPTGKLKTKVDRNGNTTTYTYDCHDRMVSQAVGDLSIIYTYDNNGNQLTMTDSTGTTARTYDELNRVKTKSVPGIGTTLFKYDITIGVNAGCVAETSTDPKENITTKVYDKIGRLSEVRADGNTTTYEYDENGNRKSVTYDGIAKEVYEYNADNLLVSLTNLKSDGTTVINTYTYTYDTAHNQTSKVEIKGLDTYTTTYSYDCLNRLEKVTEPDGKSTRYTFDNAGNRIVEAVTQGATTTVTTYEYNEQNRLTSTVTRNSNGSKDTTVYRYDNNGNMTYKAVETTKKADPTDTVSFSAFFAGDAPTGRGSMVAYYEYDVFNQLIKSMSGSNTVTCSYNGEGLRVSKTINGATTKYLYEYDKVVLETNEYGVQTARNIYGTNLIARQVDSDKLYYLYNGHADVTVLLRTDGSVAGTYNYDAFGNIIEQTGNVNNNITYAGYQYDKETGLYYLMSRMYDPKVARFLQEDTYRGDKNDPLSLNLYTYCHNEPLMYWDYDGHTYWNYDKIQKSGSKNNDVVLIQKRLEEIGYLQMPTKNGKKVAYGYYGELTQKAVKKFQQDQYNTGNYYWLTKKSIDGIVGKGTWALLGLPEPGDSSDNVYLTSNNGTASAIAGATKTAAVVTNKAVAVKINKMLDTTDEFKKTIDVPILRTGEAAKKADAVIDAGSDLKYSLSITGNYGLKIGGISKANYATELSTVSKVSKVAGTAAKILTPIIEYPNSDEVYSNLCSSNSTTTEKVITKIGAAGDAVSFGAARSIIKMPTLLQYTPLMTEEQANQIEDWANRNINGVNANVVIDNIYTKIMN